MSHFGGVKVVLERALRRAKDWDMVGGEGVWSGRLRRRRGGALRPERETGNGAFHGLS